MTTCLDPIACPNEKLYNVTCNFFIMPISTAPNAPPPLKDSCSVALDSIKPTKNKTEIRFMCTYKYVYIIICILFWRTLLLWLILYSHHTPMHGSNIRDGPSYRFDIMQIGLHTHGLHLQLRYTFAMHDFGLHILLDTNDSNSAL